MQYRYVCHLQNDKEVSIITNTTTPEQVLQMFSDKEIYQIDNVLYDFGKFTHIEIFELEYKITDVKDGVPVTLEEIPIPERIKYRVETPIETDIKKLPEEE